MIDFINGDCMDYLKKYPDKHFDLAIVDPPYGIGIDGQDKKVCKNPKHNRKYHPKKKWDQAIPSQEYFDELVRVSKNQIIFGGNYFVKRLHKGSKGWIVWDKTQRGLTMSDCEIAYSSFDKPTRIYSLNRIALWQEGTIHPTQKPIALYKWILKNYANDGDLILDTHVGSGSSLIACYDYGFNAVGFEIDKDYYKKAKDRLEQHQKQVSLKELEK